MKYFVLLCCALMSFNIFAQTPQAGGGKGGEMPSDGVLSGFVYEKESGQPVEYANVVIYSKRDRNNFVQHTLYEVIRVRVPGSKGSFQMLNNHAPIVSTLEKGMITVRKPEGEELSFEIKSGLVEFV